MYRSVLIMYLSSTNWDAKLNISLIHANCKKCWITRSIGAYSAAPAHADNYLIKINTSYDLLYNACLAWRLQRYKFDTNRYTLHICIYIENLCRLSAIPYKIVMCICKKKRFRNFFLCELKYKVLSDKSAFL